MRLLVSDQSSSTRQQLAKTRLKLLDLLHLHHNHLHNSHRQFSPVPIANHTLLHFTQLHLYPPPSLRPFRSYHHRLRTRIVIILIGIDTRLRRRLALQMPIYITIRLEQQQYWIRTRTRWAWYPLQLCLALRLSNVPLPLVERRMQKRGRRRWGDYRCSSGYPALDHYRLVGSDLVGVWIKDSLYLLSIINFTYKHFYIYSSVLYLYAVLYRSLSITFHRTICHLWSHLNMILDEEQ